MVLENFIAFEGGDGTGTSTQLALLRNRLESGAGRPPFHCCFEPTDGSIGRLIRAALRGDENLLPETVARLFAADRGEHLYGPGGVAERCARGELVVSDRYVPSSLVYQGLECGQTLPLSLNSLFPQPELVLYFDLDPEVAVGRLQGRAVKDAYEKLDFQLRVRERYEAILPDYAAGGSRIERIDASLSVEEVAGQVWSLISRLPIMGG
ncbi:MAG: dTMP kinase [Treponema sp. GWB1_62_6]|nr:MAG: dTMP kinase [Treponema sp. GWA1_62_8]OHE66206.1 MAG: dTMP kinase [Treponema sp. GWB1_62_6]OHE67437.1 MAG: dTMP kinase [Treponema sp. GWC1_61_84]OHE76769.1 MAG: dTMP kinase [Treponema sp. RIFOXYC1_FULL_61_9]HCM28377.1 dTMP kinase [Treponema sp.]